MDRRGAARSSFCSGTDAPLRVEPARGVIAGTEASGVVGDNDGGLETAASRRPRARTAAHIAFLLSKRDGIGPLSAAAGGGGSRAKRFVVPTAGEDLARQASARSCGGKSSGAPRRTTAGSSTLTLMRPARGMRQTIGGSGTRPRAACAPDRREDRADRRQLPRHRNGGRRRSRWELRPAAREDDRQPARQTGAAAIAAPAPTMRSTSSAQYPASRSTSRVCSPSRGAGVITLPGVCENFTGRPIAFVGPAPG